LTSTGYRYEPVSCRLERKPKQLRRCLKGRHILFFGDSVQRYLYLSLAKFLVDGSFPSDGDPLCWENSYLQPTTQERQPDVNRSASEYEDHWRAYFTETNRALGGHEVCDCFRESCCTDERVLVENRFTEVRGVQVSFVSQLSRPEWRPHGTVSPGSHRSMAKAIACDPGTCNRTNESGWAMDGRDFMRTALPLLGVTDVIINSGHHWSSILQPKHERYVEELFAAAAEGASHRAWYRTTTPRIRNDVLSRTTMQGHLLRAVKLVNGSWNDEGSDAARRNGLGVFDAFEAVMRLRRLGETHVRGAYLDGLHFTCSVNRELLLLMLSALCA